jgi:pimeloyl-ACP methyl ester carboxylesterase
MWLNVLARILLQVDPDGFAAQVEAIVSAPDELRFELAKVRVPTLVITGSQDALTPVGDAEELAELIPTARLYVLRGAAHGLMAEAPGPFNRTVLSFLDEVDDDRATGTGASTGAAKPRRVSRPGSAAAGGTRATN